MISAINNEKRGLIDTDSNRWVYDLYKWLRVQTMQWASHAKEERNTDLAWIQDQMQPTRIQTLFKICKAQDLLLDYQLDWLTGKYALRPEPILTGHGRHSWR